jgi:hypothetical protein
MGMLMVLVMPVAMFMLHHFVSVFMLVAFGEMQPQANGHQASCGNEPKLGRKRDGRAARFPAGCGYNLAVIDAQKERDARRFRGK